MKAVRYYILPALLPLVLLAACNRDGERNAAGIELEVYERAVQFNDAATAINAVHRLIATDTAAYSTYYDTLASLYYTSQQYIPAIQAGKEMLKHQPESERMLKLLARSYQFAGAGEQAVPYFLKLSTITHKPEYDYHLAFAHYEAGQYEQADSFARKALRSNQLDSASILIFFGEANEMQQEVPIKAAAYNVLGMSAVQTRRYDEAGTFFEEALKIFPDFVLARQGLDYINEVVNKNKGRR